MKILCPLNWYLNSAGKITLVIFFCIFSEEYITQCLSIFEHYANQMLMCTHFRRLEENHVKFGWQEIQILCYKSRGKVYLKIKYNIEWNQC